MTHIRTHFLLYNTHVVSDCTFRGDFHTLEDAYDFAKRENKYIQPFEILKESVDNNRYSINMRDTDGYIVGGDIDDNDGGIYYLFIADVPLGYDLKYRNELCSSRDPVYEIIKNKHFYFYQFFKYDPRDKN